MSILIAAKMVGWCNCAIVDCLDECLTLFQGIRNVCVCVLVYGLWYWRIERQLLELIPGMLKLEPCVCLGVCEGAAQPRRVIQAANCVFTADFRMPCLGS